MSTINRAWVIHATDMCGCKFLAHVILQSTSFLKTLHLRDIAVPRDGIELVTPKLFHDRFLKCRLPCSRSGLCLALPCLSVEVVCRGIGKGGLLLRQVASLEEGFLHSLLVASKTPNGLIVSKLGELEQHGVVDGGLGLLIRLKLVSQCL